jgi:hypothetical protein
MAIARVAAALGFLALCARAQLVTLCPAAQGSAAEWTGAVQGLANPETYVVLLHLLPDGVTAWGAAVARGGARPTKRRACGPGARPPKRRGGPRP